MGGSGSPPHLLGGLPSKPVVALPRTAMDLRRFRARRPDVTIGWHTDGAYWQMCTGVDEMLTALIPLHDADESMETLVIIDGSHRWERTPEVEALLLRKTFRGADQDSLEAQLESLGLPVQRVPVVLSAGQISFHHSMVVHGSGANRAKQPRIAVVVDMQPADNRHRWVNGANGAPLTHSNDRLALRDAAGAPDYTDPSPFPLLWGGLA